MEEHHLFQPLLSGTTTTAEDDQDFKFLSSGKAISFRLLLVIFIGIIAIWARYEDSKGFDIVITNESKDSPAGKHFQLFYVSNDKATRIIQNTSSFVENLLYPDTTTNHHKKQVRSVTLRLSSNNVNRTRIPVVDQPKTDEFVISISPSVMEDSNTDHAIISAIQRGMARVWLWDGDSRAPPWLVDGLVEYVSKLAGFGGSCCERDDKETCRVMAKILDHCEEDNKGCIQRLNQAMTAWGDDRTVDDALGLEAKSLFDYYKEIA